MAYMDHTSQYQHGIDKFGIACAKINLIHQLRATLGFLQ